MIIEYTASLDQFIDNRVYSQYLHIPKQIAEPFIDGDNRRVICELNGQVKIHSGLMPSSGGYFILINKKLQVQLGLKLGADVHLRIEKDNSEYGMNMPEELAVLMQQDSKGYEYFHALTAGKQRNLIYIVSQVKNTDSRMTKALAVIDHLKEASGKLDFKQLMAKIKKYNQNQKLRN